MKTGVAAAELLRKQDPDWATRAWALVLGSGWGDAIGAIMQVEGSIDYADLPEFPRSTVAGHAGRLVWGTIGGVPLYCMQGRFHYYEGYAMTEITLPIRVFAQLEVKALFLTNAAGAIQEGAEPGDMMLIRDHINLMGANPLLGPNDEALGPRFLDMTAAWDPRLCSAMEAAAQQAGIALRQGVYLAVAGPNFETPAEVRAFGRMGADAVGMSTVPECLVARHAGMRVVGLSCLTNLAAGIGSDPLSHEDVSATAAIAQKRIQALLERALPLLAASV